MGLDGNPPAPLSLLGICHHIILFFFESVANFFGSQGRLFIECLKEVPVLLENISLIRQNAREQLMNLGTSGVILWICNCHQDMFIHRDLDILCH